MSDEKPETYLLHLLKPTYNNTKQRVEEFSSEDSSLKVSTLIQKQLSHFVTSSQSHLQKRITSEKLDRTAPVK